MNELVLFISKLISGIFVLFFAYRVIKNLKDGNKILSDLAIIDRAYRYFISPIFALVLFIILFVLVLYKKIK